MMRYLLDSNILRHYLAQHPVLLVNIAKVPKDLIQIPFVVVAEQMRGRYDAILKAEAKNLLREQQRLIITQGLLSRFEVAYLNEQSAQEFINLQAKKKLRKRYADAIIAVIAIANHDIVVTRNVEDFKDLLPTAQIQNWIDQVYG
jgi:predicted nucleic acid-binding protein